MNNTAFRTWDDANICELMIQYPELPETIRQSIEETISNNASRCLDPIKAKGQCLRMSDELMLNLSERGTEAFADSKIIFTKKPYPHFWIYVDGWHIDLTARQFDPEAPCPKIWKGDEISSSNLYYVEKGKGLVLFQLVPFNQRSKAVNSIQRLSLFLKSRLQHRFDLLTRIINHNLDNISNRESSFR
jgi:hypothetical protein